MVADIELLKDRVAALNDRQPERGHAHGAPGGRTPHPRAGREAVYQLTCRDRNRLALQSDLLSAPRVGVRNLLCLTGDHPVLAIILRQAGL